MIAQLVGVMRFSSQVQRMGQLVVVPLSLFQGGSQRVFAGRSQVFSASEDRILQFALVWKAGTCSRVDSAAILRTVDRWTIVDRQIWRIFCALRGFVRVGWNFVSL